MQQTDNLHLNIWSPQDAVDVEQINSNFQALDKAHAALTQEQEKTENRFPKMLLDVTTESQARQVDLDLKSISLTEYDWLDLYMDLTGTDQGSYKVGMRVNNSTAGDYLVEDDSGRGTYFDVFNVRANDETNVQQCRIFGGRKPIFTGFVFCAAGRYANTFTTRKSIAVMIPTNEVTGLNLFAEDDGKMIPAGSRIRVLGVKL